MKKKLKWVLIIVVLVIVVAVVSVYLTLNTIAKAAVERGATRALAVPTTVGDLDLKLMRGQVEIENLKVANVPGYKADYFLKLDDGDLAVSIGSLAGDTVQVPHLKLTGMEVYLERNQKGEANYNKILENLRRFESTDPQTQEGKKYVIQTLEIRDVNVHMDVPMVGNRATRMDMVLDPIILKNVGSGTSRGVLVAELSDIIIKAVFVAVVRKGGGMIPAEIGKDLASGLAQLTELSKLGIGTLDGAGEVIGGLSGKAGELGGEVGNVGKETGKTLEGLGGFLKKKGDDASTTTAK